MLFNVPKGMSLFGCGTVARPFFFVAADLIHFVPTIPRQRPDSFPTVHSGGSSSNLRALRLWHWYFPTVSTMEKADSITFVQHSGLCAVLIDGTPFKDQQISPSIP